MARKMTGVVHFELVEGQEMTERLVRKELLRLSPRGARLTGTVNYATRLTDGQMTGHLVSCWYVVERET